MPCVISFAPVRPLPAERLFLSGFFADDRVSVEKYFSKIARAARTTFGQEKIFSPAPDPPRKYSQSEIEAKSLFRRREAPNGWLRLICPQKK
jgi:hypothetical protein